MTTTYRTLRSPIGLLTLAGSDGVLHHVRMEHQSHPPADQPRWRHDPHSYDVVVDQLGEYFCGTRKVFDVTCSSTGTAFQELVWGALRTIPYGTTRTYGEVAEQIGRPRAARAVGLANGRNPLGIIVPCHRVIGANGSLVGYGGGLDRKQTLLRLEEAAFAAKKETESTRRTSSGARS